MTVLGKKVCTYLCMNGWMDVWIYVQQDLRWGSSPPVHWDIYMLWTGGLEAQRPSLGLKGHQHVKLAWLDGLESDLLVALLRLR